MIPKFKSLRVQVKETTNLLKEDSVLVLVSFVMMILINVSSVEVVQYNTLLLLGTSHLLTIFLLFILLYNIYTKLNDTPKEAVESILDEIKNLNYILFTLFIFLIMFIVFFTLEYVSKYPVAIGWATGVATALWLIPFYFIISTSIPLMVGKFARDKMLREEKLNDKMIVHIPTTMLLIGLPLWLTYSSSDEVVGFFSIIIFSSIFVGILLLVDGISDYYQYYQKHKVTKAVENPEKK